MKHNYSKFLSLLLLPALSAAPLAAEASRQAPSTLSATATGSRVDLKWENSDAATPLVDCGFEDEAFPSEGWNVKTTNSNYYMYTWFHAPGSDLIENERWPDFIHSGQGSAMILYDMRGQNSETQDEWLITPQVESAAYLEFYSYIDPMVREWGAVEGFPDHYCVKTSYDDGATWNVVWNAATDASLELKWQSVVIPLEHNTPVRVAFHACSDGEEGLHLLWAVDDVKISRSKSDKIIDSYTVKLDGEVIASGLKSLEFSDLSDKTTGNYKYEVFAESGGKLSSVGSTVVTIGNLDMLSPTNLRLEAALDDFDNTYTITAEWDAPDGEFRPSSYNLYCDGVPVAIEFEETSISYFGYTKGIYEFAVTANYTSPDGESEPAKQRIAIDTRLNPANLKAECSGNDVVLTWDAPESTDFAVKHYQVWRGEKMIASELKETAITDSNVPAGFYRYSVIAVYDDGVSSIAAKTEIATGDSAPRPLPFTENFNSGFLPSDWIVENHYEDTPDYLLWAFNDPNGIGITGAGFDGRFASIDCINAGFYPIESSLITPPVNVAGLDLGDLAMAFSYDYASDGMSTLLMVEIQADGEGEWFPAFVPESYEPSVPGTYSPKRAFFTLDNLVGNASSIRMRWYYNSMMDLHFALDNVVIGEAASIAAPVVDPTVNVKVTADGFLLSSSDPISSVELFTIDGAAVASVKTAASEVAVPATPGLYILRVTTATAVTSMKVIR